jgi:hypothetical protein
MKLPTDKTLVIVEYDRPEVVAVANLYHPGDLWLKIRRCQDCPPESVRICCGKCPHRMDKGCQWHFEGRRSAKPFVCTVDPDPRQTRSFCQLEYECVEGHDKGYIRCVRDKNGQLRTSR